MAFFQRTNPNEILVVSNEAVNQAKVVASLEKDFLKYAETASARTYQSNEELGDVREIFSNKLRKL